MRQLPLGFITALLVARPFVLGEDPGLLAPLSGTSNLVLTLFWFFAAVAWAAWRAWSGQRSWVGSSVEAGLLTVVGITFVSAGAAAHYKHPAWLIAWEWAALLLAFVVIRQVARTPDDNRGLLSALLATAVTLSVYAVYQYAMELPRTRAQFADAGQLQARLAEQGVFVGPDDLKAWQRRAEMSHAFATYAHPNAFAGYLALLLPAAAGYAWQSLRSYGRGRWTYAAAACVALLLAALWLTHSRGALLALSIVAVGVGAVAGRATLAKHRVQVLIGLFVLAAVALAVRQSGVLNALFGKDERSAGYRLDYWTATWAMIREQGWLGVGPGNFGRLYPRFMLPTASEKIQDPHNVILEVWATCGFLGVVAFLAFLMAFFHHTRRAWLASSSHHPITPSPFDPSGRWTLYLGGTAGLLLGFLLRASNLSADEILIEGVVSGVRSLVWFAAFAVFDRYAWTGMVRVRALAAGVAALLMNLTVSGGIGAPSVVLPLLAVMALALNGLDPAPTAMIAPGWWGRMLPLPLSAGAAVIYFILIFQPVTDSTALTARAKQHGPVFLGRVQEVEQRLPANAQPAEHDRAKLPLHAYLTEHVLRPLLRARDADPGDATPRVELANWLGAQWELAKSDRDVAKMAVASALQAQQLDPDGKDGYLAEVRLRHMFAKHAPKNAAEQYRFAAKALQALIHNDPTEPRLRYQLAETLLLAENKAEGKLQAEEALRLDAVVAENRRLNDEERQKLQKWLEK